mmetsp:Transcript_31290/g.86142  ORF Transcript_31290/g.86142 Transcript_31290/m.86142 type:complete len:202 (+) Transcript_31290:1038-1643(+)
MTTRRTTKATRRMSCRWRPWKRSCTVCSDSWTPRPHCWAGPSACCWAAPRRVQPWRCMPRWAMLGAWAAWWPRKATCSPRPWCPPTGPAAARRCGSSMGWRTAPCRGPNGCLAPTTGCASRAAMWSSLLTTAWTTVTMMLKVDGSALSCRRCGDAGAWSRERRRAGGVPGRGRPARTGPPAAFEGGASGRARLGLRHGRVH